ncbi:CARDB domain-containing protein [Arcicella lustrica]|uniref:CARDB domain-containing protein n=1 Tax=Arcicella lustrica TaxID=2984196 RepID=A0ABU5SPH3_9BACT|nr:CARDB domain-containing protein [Arcicella sp. DC25W]MEA5429214.1 CARDB domain-containing protein [Arcicella sp. DC25W]
MKTQLPQKLKKLFNFCALITLFSFTSYAQTTVSGDVSGKWTKAKSPYIISGSVTVPSGATLTIDPGVEIRSSDYRNQISINGTLIAKGTVTDSIRFKGFANTNTSTVSTHGGSLQFGSGSKGSQLEYIVMDQWGDINYWSYYGAIYINSSDVSITKSTIRNSESFGIKVENNTISPKIANNNFQNNPYSIISYISTSSNISLNTNANIRLFTNYSTTQDGTLKKQGINSYFEINNNTLTISVSDTLTIEPGTEIRSNNYTDNFRVYGTLIAKGTATDSIRFKGFANPSYSTYSTNGGSLRFESGSKNSQLEYISMDKWGDANYYGNAIYINSSGVSITKSTIRNSENYGIYIENSAISPTITNNNFQNNPYGIGTSLSACSNVFSNINASIRLFSSSTTQDGILKKQAINSYFILDNNTVNISKDHTLTIEAGTEIRSNNYSDVFRVYGTLIAKGTATDSIRFRGFANPSYSTYSTHGGSLRFESSSKNSQLEYISMDKWGDANYWGNAIYINSTGVSIAKSTFRNSENYGIFIENSAISPTITNNNFQNNPYSIGTSLSACSNVFSNINASIRLFSTSTTQDGAFKKQGLNSYFLLDNNSINVSKDDTLIIEAGTEIRSNNYSDVFRVYGTLIAKGTATDSIRFRGFANPSYSTNSTHGGSLRFESGSKNSQLEYISMDKWGDTNYWGNAIYINSTGVSIAKSTFRNSESYGIYIASKSIYPTIQNNNFLNNPTDIFAYVENCGFFLNNVNAKILLNGGYMVSNSSLPFPGKNAYYILNGQLTVQTTYTLTIEAGTTIDFSKSYSFLSIYGTLRAIGTEVSPIQFIRLQAPDTYAYGGSVFINSSSTDSRLSYVLFDKLGSSYYGYPALSVYTNNFSINNITISNSLNNGLEYSATGSPRINTSNFYNNSKSGIYVSSGSPIFDKCNIYGNTDYGINNVSSSRADTVDARNSYWGDAKGPYHAKLNPQGVGNKVSDKVKFNPWKQQALNGQIIDVGIMSVLSPFTDCNLSDTVSVKIRIGNFGNVSLSNIPITYKINNGTSVIDTVSNTTILPGKTLNYTFKTKAKLSALGTYKITVFTKMAKDSVLANDSTSVTIQHLPNVSAPSNLIPANNSTGHDNAVALSWTSVTNTTGYDLYIWKTNNVMPSTPSVSNISQIVYTVNNLEYGTQYKWKVVARRVSCKAESVVQSFTTRQLPDLIIESITVPQTAVSETDIVVNFKVKNQGIGGTGSVGWYDVVYLSDQPNLNTGSEIYYIASSSNLSALTSGQSYQTQNYTFRLPQGAQGNYYVIVKTNDYRSLTEGNTTNNQSVSNPIKVSLAPPPDLQVSSVIVSPLNTFSEDEVIVTYNVKNLGTGITTNKHWYDYIYLTKDEVLNQNTATLLYTYSRNQALAVNGEYTVSTKVKLPARISGTYYVHVATDRLNNVYEYNKEENNTNKSSALTVVQKPTPDLTVNSLSFSVDSVSNNQPITIQWITANDGAIAAQPYWDENIYLSSDAIFNNGNDLSVGSLNRSAVLNSLNSISGQQTINIPTSLKEGNYYFFVKTDASNYLYENPDENNNVSKVSSVITVVNADLKPTLINASATAQSEQSIVVQWKVKNDSRANIINSTWTDRVYLSANTTFEYGTDILLGSASLSQLLAKGSEYNKQVSVTLPEGISGKYYLLLITDDNNNIFEKFENNNIFTKAITISLAPWPDLQITSIVAPSIDTVGTTINVQYTLKNSGTGNISNKNWTDYIYLTPSNNANEASLILIGKVRENRSLASGQTSIQKTSFTLPSLAVGKYYMVIKTDLDKEVFENTGEDNNLLISLKLLELKQIIIQPIDLSLSTGKILSNTVVAGQTVNIEWTVKNNSAYPTSVSSWRDAIYLSNSSVLNTYAELLSTVSINNTLSAGGTYTQTATVTIPQTASGNLYILVNTDRDNQNNDPSRGNNTLALNTGSGGQTVVITTSPPADLVAKSLTVPSQGTLSQPIEVSFTIKNQGTGSTPADTWVDQLYLSTDMTLGNGNDILIGTFQHTGSQTAGTEYTTKGQVFLPNNVSGNYIILLKTDAYDNVFERNNEGNNLAFANIYINPQQPSDLFASDISVPTTPQYAGTNTTISWQLKNIGTNNANGYLREAIYLSKDSTVDASDVLFGVLDQYAYLPTQASEKRSLTKLLSNITVGEYFVIVKTDILNNIVESNEDNNLAIAVSKLKVSVKELPIGKLTGDTLVNNTPLYYQISVPANLVGETLSILLKGDSVQNATNRVFLSLNNVPDANHYDFASTIPFKANQEIIVPALSSGIYYLAGFGIHPSKEKQAISLLAKIIPFSITSVNSNKGGNTGSVTVKIEGAKFEKGMTISLSGQNKVYTATNVYYIDQSKLFATFNLSAAPLGLYTVILKKQNNSTTQLKNGFEVINGSPGGVDGSSLFTCSIQNIGFDDNIGLDIIRPESIRRNQVAKITIVYTNNGNVDIPVQTRMFLSLGGAPINFSPEFSKQIQELVLDFKESDGPPDVIRAGASGFINIYSKATAPLSFIITK